MGTGYSVHYYHHGGKRRFHPRHYYHAYYPGFPGYPWWGYHYIWNELEKKKMLVKIEKVSESKGKVYTEDGKKLIANIDVQTQQKSKTAEKRYDNSAVVYNKDGSIVGEICTSEEDLEDSDDWRGYKWTIRNS